MRSVDEFKVFNDGSAELHCQPAKKETPTVQPWPGVPVEVGRGTDCSSEEHSPAFASEIRPVNRNRSGAVVEGLSVGCGKVQVSAAIVYLIAMLLVPIYYLLYYSLLTIDY